ncbi:MAG TPA: hypothetical protein VFJ82_13315 [Longimicrobium sp.]|nr:hypothetical protein [Longimicrobium sp.]
MEPQDNKTLALQKAISSHEQAEAAIADLLKDGDDPMYTGLLERIRENMAQLRADLQGTGPGEHV